MSNAQIFGFNRSPSTLQMEFPLRTFHLPVLLCLLPALSLTLQLNFAYDNAYAQSCRLCHFLWFSLYRQDSQFQTIYKLLLLTNWVEIQLAVQEKLLELFLRSLRVFHQKKSCPLTLAPDVLTCFSVFFLLNKKNPLYFNSIQVLTLFNEIGLQI